MHITPPGGAVSGGTARYTDQQRSRRPFAYIIPVEPALGSWYLQYMDMPEGIPPVAIATGETRLDAVRNALALVREEVLARCRGRVMIKPNFLSSSHSPAATMPDAVRPVLELLRGAESVTGVVIGEGGSRSTGQAFDNFGYRPLLDEFGIEAVDLNHRGHHRCIPIISTGRRSMYAACSDYLSEVDTVVSVAVAKTHDTAALTFSIKNMMGCLRRVHRPRMHGIRIGEMPSRAAEWLWNTVEGHPAVIKSFSGAVFTLTKWLRAHGPGAFEQAMLHRQVGAMSENLARLAEVLMPDVAVIDGFTAMEGNGPGSSGRPVDLRVAVAGTDPVACDTVMAHLMGFDVADIGYLALCGERGLGVIDLSRMELRGEDPGRLRRECAPHDNFPVQRRWRDAWKD